MGRFDYDGRASCGDGGGGDRHNGGCAWRSSGCVIGVGPAASDWQRRAGGIRSAASLDWRGNVERGWRRWRRCVGQVGGGDR